MTESDNHASKAHEPSARIRVRMAAAVLLAAAMSVSATPAFAAKPVVTVGLGQGTYSAVETAASLTVDIVRSDAKGSASVVFSTADGTAVAGTDFTAVSVVVKFGPGVTTRQVTVPLIDDAVIGDANKSFTVRLSSAKSMTLGAAPQATVTILNAPSMGISIAPGTTFSPPSTVGDSAGAVGLVYSYSSITVSATGSSGDVDTGFVGDVSLSSSADCELVVEGGPSYTYGAADAGTHVFRIAFGATSAFGTTGADPTQLGAKQCTVTAHDQGGAYADAAAVVTALAGEYCDARDNNGNGLFDEFYPSLGSPVNIEGVGSGTWVCSADHTGILALITTPAPIP